VDWLRGVGSLSPQAGHTARPWNDGKPVALSPWKGLVRMQDDNQDGFTLLEAMISVALIVLLFGLITQALISWTRTSIFSSNLLDASSECQKALTAIREDLLQSSTKPAKSEISWDGTTLEFKVATGSNPDGTTIYSANPVSYTLEAVPDTDIKRIKKQDTDGTEVSVGNYVSDWTDGSGDVKPAFEADITDPSNIVVTVTCVKGRGDNRKAVVTRTIRVLPLNED
jgi:type II secretory pathway pseudopilin PulG